MQITLKAGSKIYINGAVLRVDRRVNIELMNEAVFLLENHIMQVNEADTPLKQVYFVIQSVLIEPATQEQMKRSIIVMLRAVLSNKLEPAVSQEIEASIGEIEANKYFFALKRIRHCFSMDMPEGSVFNNRSDLLLRGAI